MDQQKAIEDVALIKRMMEESRQFTFDNGKSYIFWGILVTVGIFVTYGAVLTGNGDISGWIWIITIGIGWLFSILAGMKEHTKTRTWAFGGKLVGLIWASCGITMTILGFAAPLAGALHSWAISPAIATVMGAAYTMSSLVYRLKWVTMVGIAWWVGALAMFAVKGLVTLPIFGSMMILFQIIPGLVFYRNSKKSNASGDTK
ncbi:MAG: hypothetical protein M1470_11855 [Bacteroidetes bacterium]|nr:hypothetical protein [Bacteroidota bacterium]MCL5738675.1 hypothetical protein [Bacteroidota bacterium]